MKSEFFWIIVQNDFTLRFREFKNAESQDPQDAVESQDPHGNDESQDPQDADAEYGKRFKFL